MEQKLKIAVFIDFDNIEIGVKSMPTVAGLATNTLKLPEYSHNTTEVLNSERDAAVLFATDTDPDPEDDEQTQAPAAKAATVEAAPVALAGAPGPNVAPTGAPRPDDIGYDAADATMALIALGAKMRIDQIEALDSIESITDGASSRRNQLLVDLGSELNLGAIDGAGEADLAGLKGQVTKLARTYKPYGPVLSDAINDQLRTASQYDPIVVRSANGTVVRLSAIASIEPGVRNTLSAGWYNKQPSVLLVITKDSTANVIETVDSIYAALPDIKRYIPADIDVSVLSDRTGTIRASIHDMQITLCITIVLVMMVVLVFLRRLAATIAAGVTVPA